MSKAQTPGMLDLHDYVQTVTIQHPVHGPIPFRPFDYQTTMLQHVEDNPLSALVIARQMGSTTGLMAWALWTAAARPGSKIVIMSNALCPAIESLDRARYMLETGPAAVPYVRLNTKSRVEFNNGSSIEATALRPMNHDAAYTHLIIMNAGFVAPTRMVEAWASFQPHMARGMRAVLQCCGGLTSTVFYQVVKNAGRNGFALLSQDWRAHPDRDENWAETYRVHISEKSFRQQFENQFTDD